MLKFSTVILLLLTFNTAAFSGDEDVERKRLRRTLTLKPSQDEWALQRKSGFAKELSTIVTCCIKDPKKYKILKTKAFRLINQNPDNANPYVKKYEVHLITLASRYGMIDFVEAIALNNQQSIHCLDKENRTPLDEAIIFEKADVARYLHSLGASQNQTTSVEYEDLCPSKKRKRKK